MIKNHCANRHFAALLATYCFVLAPHKAKAASMLHRNVEQLTSLSENILLGRVLNVSGGIANGVPYSEIVIDITERLKGDLSGKFKFRQFGLQEPLVMPDGRVNLNLTPQGWPIYRRGEKVALFLYSPAKRTGLRTTVGLLQGKFNISGTRLANAINNEGLFKELSISFSKLAAAEKRLLKIERGPVDVMTFCSLVKKLVQHQSPD